MTHARRRFLAVQFTPPAAATIARFAPARPRMATSPASSVTVHDGCVAPCAHDVTDAPRCAIERPSRAVWAQRAVAAVQVAGARRRDREAARRHAGEHKAALRIDDHPQRTKPGASERHGRTSDRRVRRSVDNAADDQAGRTSSRRRRILNGRRLRGDAHPNRRGECENSTDRGRDGTSH